MDPPEEEGVEKALSPPSWFGVRETRRTRRYRPGDLEVEYDHWLMFGHVQDEENTLQFDLETARFFIMRMREYYANDAEHVDEENYRGVWEIMRRGELVPTMWVPLENEPVAYYTNVR